MIEVEMFRPVVDCDLRKYSKGWQFGEQGILVELANRLPLRKVCVEVGAGDGEGLPVTVEPLYDAGWQTSLWEADANKRLKLQEKFKRATIQGKCLTLDMATYRDALVIIDVDGVDWWLFASLLNAYQKPGVIMVEHADLNGMQPAEIPGLAVADGSRQATYRQLQSIAEGLYTLIGYTRVNSIFVRDDLLEVAKCCK